MFNSTSDFGIKISTVAKLSWKSSEHYVPPRSQYALVYRLKGTADFEFDNGMKLSTKDGEVLYCPAGMGYRVWYSDGEIIVFHFQAGGLPAVPSVKLLPNSRRVFGIFEEALIVWNDHRVGYYYKALSLFFEILSICSIDYYSKIEHKAEFDRACDYLKNSIFDSRISIGEICRNYEISESAFRRIFFEQYGISPVKYIAEVRIRKAERLLVSTDLTIEKIAYKCGFSDVKYFSRVFSKLRSCPPSMFRKY